MATSDSSGEPPSSPSSSSSSSLVVPAAAIIAVSLMAFLGTVLIFLCLRKFLQKRGVSSAVCCPAGCERCAVCGGCGGCAVCSGCGGCRDGCLVAAERLDLPAPDCGAFLDCVCPSKQSCRVWWARLCSCHGCLVLADHCKRCSHSLCPGDSPGLECPAVTCCGDCCLCNCKVKIPECSEVTILCLHFNCSGSGSGEDNN